MGWLVSSPPDSILIVGSGSMACLFAARLSAAGVAVTMLAGWPAGLEALRRDGVTVVEADGSERSYPVEVTADPVDCTGARFALVLVKSWQTERAALQLEDCLAAGGVALTLQNGLGNREKLAEHLGGQRVALGVTTFGANLIGPGRVRPAGDGVISLGAHPLMDRMAVILRSCGFPVEMSPDPSGLLWGKLVINAAINPITALLGITNGELLERPSARALLASVAQEVAAVAAAHGVRLPYPDPVEAVEVIAQRTAANRSSMLQDVTRGAPTEIDAICGAIVDAGERTGVPTPVNRTLGQLVKALSDSGSRL
jgi:2-dehydropantoate 2-reductase